MAESRRVLLPGGGDVDADAYCLALDLESRGINIRLEIPDGAISLGPRSKVTNADYVAARRHRADLARIIEREHVAQRVC